MGLVVNTNVGSLNAQRSLAVSSAELKTAMERLSSGSKINSASDDAAGFAIAERMTAQIRGLNMAAKNAGDGLSMLSAIENATNDVTDMLQRMRELAVQAVNDTNTQQDREYLQGEVSALIAEIDRVATQTQYNGQAILDGSMSGKIQVGTEANQTVGFSINSIRASDLGKQSAISIGKVTADTVYDQYSPPNVATFYMENTDVELSRGDVVSFEGAAGEYIVDSAHYETYEEWDAPRYRVNIFGSISSDDKAAISGAGSSVLLGTDRGYLQLSSNGWSVAEDSEGNTHVVAQNSAYNSLIDSGGLTTEDEIVLAYGWPNHTQTPAVWQPTSVIDDGSSLSFPPANASGTSGPDVNSSNLGAGNIVLKSLAIEGDSLTTIDVSSAVSASEALSTITAALEQVAGDRAEYGALQNRLEYTVSNLMNVSEFTTAARSRIADADFAAESARLAKAQVLQQSGTAMLAQANASSLLALSLIR